MSDGSRVDRHQAPPDVVNWRGAGGDRREREPLLLWRAPSIVAEGPYASAAIARLLGSVEILGEPDWSRAVGHEAAAAVGIALRRVTGPVTDDASTSDVLMSCLLLHVWRGSAGAALAFHHLRRRLAPVQPIEE